MSNISLVQAARSALAETMQEDSRIHVLGEDVSSGGPFGLTKGLLQDFGSGRIRNTPISEASFVGVGLGLALGGAHPLVDIMFNDFITLASDQLFNQAAKVHFMSGGRYSVPLTIWTVAGAGTRWGAQHSQRLDGWLAQIPGLKVLSPASPGMMFHSIKAALKDPDPVVMLIDRSLLYSQKALAGDDGSPWQPRIVKSGDQITIATTGRLVHIALEVASTLPVAVEIIDLQRLSPVNVELICESVQKTGNLLLIHDEVANGGLVSSLALAVYDQAYWSLDSPIAHLTSPPTPVPAAANLEDAYLVNALSIRRAILEMIGK